MVKSKGKKAREEPEPEVYAVEVILGARVVEVDDSDDGKSKKRKRKSKKDKLVADWEYHIKWAGYPDSQSSWEPAKNVKECGRLLTSFWAVIGGSDDQDYMLNQEVLPPAEWIEKEKRRFARDNPQYDAGPSEKKKGTNKAAESPEQRKPSISSSLVKKHKQQPMVILDSSESDEEPLRKKMKSSKVEKLFEEQREAVPSETHGDGGDKTQKVSKGKMQRKRSEPVDSSSARTSQPKDRPPDSPSSPNSLFSRNSDEPSPPSPIAKPSPVPPPLPSRNSIPTLPLPARQPRSQINPHAKLAELPPTSVTAGVGISTKQRLGQGALAPVAPKKSTSSKAAKGPPLPPIKTNSSTLMSIGFKKNLPTPTGGPSHQEPTLASLNSMPESPISTTAPGSATDIPMTASPVSYAPQQTHFDLFGASVGPSSLSMQTSQPLLMTQAVDFLSAIMPAQLAAPLEPAPEPAAEIMPPPPLPSRVPPLPKRIPKKWKWTGSVLVIAGRGEDRKDSAFKVIIDSETELKRTMFRFSVALNPTEELRLEALYDLAELNSIFPACKSPCQLARVTLQPEEDAKSWLIFLRYMVRTKKVSLAPIYLDGNLVAHVLLFPSFIKPWANLTLPPEYRSADSLVAALIPLTLSQVQISQESHRPFPESIRDDGLFETLNKSSEPSKIKLKNEKLWAQALKSRPKYQHALRVLNFPSSIYHYLKQTSRAWAIIAPHDTEASKTVNLESDLLRSIFSRIREEALLSAPGSTSPRPVYGKQTTPEAAGMIFMHTGALRHLHKFPFFLSRIVSDEYPRFYMFGSHPSFPSQFWGVREIFPCGGVVTFAPSAFMLHPLEMMQKMRQIHDHPFWTAYILPSVLGMVARLCGIHMPGGPVDEFPHHYLLQAIEEGAVALIQAPPEGKSCYGAIDQRQHWLHDYIGGIPRSADDALTLGLNAFNSSMANLSQLEWQMKVENEIARDLANMQMQPSILTEYRHFVVLTGTESKREDSLQWVLPPNFEFKDAFVQ